jgi:hypothetical protein
LPLVHLLGVGLALGSATTKLTLLLKSKADHGFVPTYVAVTKPITRLILTGTALLVVSGIGWLLMGYPLNDLLIIKLVLVGIIIVLGTTLDKFVEPKFLKSAPNPGQLPSPEFIQIQNRYVLVETTATGLYYVIVVMWLLAR